MTLSSNTHLYITPPSSCKTPNIKRVFSIFQITEHIRKRRRCAHVPPAPGGAEHGLHPRAGGLQPRAALLGGGVAGAAARHARRGRRRDQQRAAALGGLPEPGRRHGPELGLGFGQK